MSNHGKALEQPFFASIKDWTKLAGMSRSKTYVLLGEGKLKAVKVDGRTLIDVQRSIAWVKSQPSWRPQSGFEQ